MDERWSLKWGNYWKSKNSSSGRVLKCEECLADLQITKKLSDNIEGRYFSPKKFESFTNNLESGLKI